VDFDNFRLEISMLCINLDLCIALLIRGLKFISSHLKIIITSQTLMGRGLKNEVGVL